MPVYLLHGFRWPRPLIRIHIILQNLDDVAAEWLMGPVTADCLVENLHEICPDAMANLPKLRFIEQYDPNDETPSACSQPYAYVADVVHEITLSMAVDEATSKGIPGKQWDAILEIRDRLAPDEKVGWFVAVCGDEERYAPSLEEAGSSDGAQERVRSQDVVPQVKTYSPGLSPKPVLNRHEGCTSEGSEPSPRPRVSISTHRSTSASTLATTSGSPRGTPFGSPSMLRAVSPGSRVRDFSSPDRDGKGLKGFIGRMKKKASRTSLGSGGSPRSASAKTRTIPPVPARTTP